MLASIRQLVRSRTFPRSMRTCNTYGRWPRAYTKQCLTEHGPEELNSTHLERLLYDPDVTAEQVYTLLQRNSSRVEAAAACCACGGGRQTRSPAWADSVGKGLERVCIGNGQCAWSPAVEHDKPSCQLWLLRKWKLQITALPPQIARARPRVPTVWLAMAGDSIVRTLFTGLLTHLESKGQRHTLSVKPPATMAGVPEVERDEWLAGLPAALDKTCLG